MAKIYPEGAAAERQLASSIGKFNPAVASLIQSSRSALRKRMPRAIEQVYDNFNFLAIGFCSSERTSDCIVSLAASAKGVALSFYHGADLADPDGILLGDGKQNRFIRIEDEKTLSKRSVAALITKAIAQSPVPLPATGSGKTMIKSISTKQRSRKA